MAFSDSSKFEEIMNKIKQLITWYETKHIGQTSVRLYLASGESFNFVVTKDSIAHMLGIKTNFLATCGMFNTTKSYDLNEYSPGQDLDCPNGQSTLFESGVSFSCDALHIHM